MVWCILNKLVKRWKHNSWIIVYNEIFPNCDTLLKNAKQQTFHSKHLKSFSFLNSNVIDMQMRRYKRKRWLFSYSINAPRIRVLKYRHGVAKMLTIHIWLRKALMGRETEEERDKKENKRGRWEAAIIDFSIKMEDSGTH